MARSRHSTRLNRKLFDLRAMVQPGIVRSMRVRWIGSFSIDLSAGPATYMQMESNQ